jgi:hypothetical protein
MNREQAIRAVADKIGLSGPFTNNLVDAMEAVGVLKLDEEPASANPKWKVGDAAQPAEPEAATWGMVEALRMAGYVVWRKPDVTVPCVSVPCVSSDGRKDGAAYAIVREDTLVDILRRAGYEVRSK